jgi:hypothetical protein
MVKPITPSSVIDEMAWWSFTDLHIGARTAIDLVARGKEIPEHMLPGRWLTRYMENHPEKRDAIMSLKPEDAIKGGLWFTQVDSRRWDGKESEYVAPFAMPLWGINK